MMGPLTSRTGTVAAQHAVEKPEDGNLRIEFANDVFLEAIGWTSEAAHGRHIFEWQKRPPSTIAEIQA